MGNKTALNFQIKAKCNVSKARSSIMGLLHCEVNTPVFMPVGTQVRTSTIKTKFMTFICLSCKHLCGINVYIVNHSDVEVNGFGDMTCILLG